MSRTLSAADFQLLRDYLRATAGLEFDESRRAGLAAILHDRMQVTGAADVAGYLGMLDRPDAASERQRLLDAVTIQETHFHRARPQIDALRHHILPDVLGRAASQGREAVVWSAGCSTGEEPFTLAMLMLEVARDAAGTRRAMRVVGTDVSSAALQVAGAATYTGRTVDLAETGRRRALAAARPGRGVRRARRGARPGRVRAPQPGHRPAAVPARAAWTSWSAGT